MVVAATKTKILKGNPSTGKAYGISTLATNILEIV